MKKIKVLSFMALFVFGFLVSAYAQSAGQGKMAYVDLSRIFDQYSKTKVYDEALAKKYNDYEQERSKKLEKIKELQGKLPALKEEEKNKLSVDIEKEKSGLVDFDRQKQTDLKKERDEKMREILLEIEKTISDFAEKEKYSLILNDRVLMYGAKELDTTEQIIKMLNEKYPPKK